MSYLHIREATETDAERFLDLWDALDSETEFMLYEPNERIETLASQRSKLAKAASSEYVQILVLDDTEKYKLAGFCAGRRSNNFRDQHSLYVVIGIRAAYTGQKWGLKLLTELENWARDVQVSRMELNVMISNTRAISLYKKLGYQIEGIKRNSVYLRSGYIDEYVMAKLIDY